MGKETNENLPIEERLSRIEGLLLSNKKVLTFDEVVAYTGFKASYLYKLTSSFSIPHSKPGGGKLFFDKEDLDKWLLANKCKTNSEIDQKASNHIAMKSKHLV